MVRKLILSGYVHGSDTRRSSAYHSWPNGALPLHVEDLILQFKTAYSKVTVRLEHMLDDDNYPY